MKILDRKIIHIVNVILGIIIVPYSILELIGVFKLGKQTMYVLVPIGLFMVWLILYSLQIKKRRTLLVMFSVFINVFYLFFIIPKMLY
ncbi:hypothetical protein ABFG93_04635 [Pseudalkalibacillus hwajinpoensis]|uniref:hypothetical protein n=1 Tax=Guptibacillus hwajinpoensis TaxID=208199 RepID=UPI00325C11A6